MENATPENIAALREGWSRFTLSTNKVEAILQDIDSCKNEYTRTILFNTAMKILENLSLKEKILNIQTT